jgi:hypothetical protein
VRGGGAGCGWSAEASLAGWGGSIRRVRAGEYRYYYRLQSMRRSTVNSLIYLLSFTGVGDSHTNPTCL